mmetsp:Transcript_61804/g.146224  ORF Transcript_61804/g.146224 Transcript_61804/m.146224 type:complete len:709 (-) Transcript_61804:2222-4348(-)
MTAAPASSRLLRSAGPAGRATRRPDIVRRQAHEQQRQAGPERDHGPEHQKADRVDGLRRRLDRRRAEPAQFAGVDDGEHQQFEHACGQEGRPGHRHRKACDARGAGRTIHRLTPAVPVAAWLRAINAGTSPSRARMSAGSTSSAERWAPACRSSGGSGCLRARPSEMKLATTTLAGPPTTSHTMGSRQAGREWIADIGFSSPSARQHKGGFLDQARSLILADALDAPTHRVRAGLQLLRRLGRHAQGHRHPARLGGAKRHRRRPRQHQARQAFDLDVVALRRLGGVHDLKPVDVLDPAVLDQPRQRRTVPHDINTEALPRRQAPQQRRADDEQHRGVDDDARAPQAAPALGRAQALFEAVLGVVADQAARCAHLVHHAVAHVDAGGAAYAFVLQTVADVDAGRADLHAQAAVDAVAQRMAAGLTLPAALGVVAARLATAGVVADDQRVAVEHRALEARIGAHVFADLLAHIAGVAIGGKAVEQHPEALPGAQAQRHHLAAQAVDGREVADEGEPGPQPDRDPDRLLAGLAPELVEGPGRLVQPQPRIAVALEPVLHAHEDLGVDRLRAGVAAPQPTRDRREQEQRIGRDHQQGRQVDEVLRVEHQAENVETPRAQVEEHGLTFAPGQPGQAIEHRLSQRDDEPAPAGIEAIDGARMDLVLGPIEPDDLDSVTRPGRGGRGHGVRAPRHRPVVATAPTHRLPAHGSAPA